MRILILGAGVVGSFILFAQVDAQFQACKARRTAVRPLRTK
jgi:hypothetical protein